MFLDLYFENLVFSVSRFTIIALNVTLQTRKVTMPRFLDNSQIRHQLDETTDSEIIDAEIIVQISDFLFYFVTGTFFYYSHYSGKS
jgi:hypothetical protein